MDEPVLDVTACVERVRAGDEDAARVLMQHLHGLIVKIVRSHLPRRTSEEDLIQAVYVKVFTRIDQYRGAVPFEHWVSRVAVNTCLNQIAHERSGPSGGCPISAKTKNRWCKTSRPPITICHPKTDWLRGNSSKDAGTA